jgi:hypothetical protein
MKMKKVLLIVSVLALPTALFAQSQDNSKHDDVKVDNKVKKDKGGAKNNDALKESEKENDKKAAEFKKKKYKKLTKGSHKKEEGKDEGKDKKDDKKSKKEEKKNL